MTQRSRGILSEKEEKYLQGDTDVEPGTQNERTLRARIRSHLSKTIKDFHLIDRELQDRDRKEVFKEFPEDPREVNDFKQGANDAIRLLWRALRERDIDAEKFFEHALSGSEYDLQMDKGRQQVKRVEVDIDMDVVETKDSKTVLSQLENNEPVSMEDLEDLRADMIESDIDLVVVSRDTSRPLDYFDDDEVKDMARGKLAQRNIYPREINIVE